MNDSISNLREQLNILLDNLHLEYTKNSNKEIELSKHQQLINDQNLEIESFKKVSVVTSLNKTISQNTNEIKMLKKQLELSEARNTKLKNENKNLLKNTEVKSTDYNQSVDVRSPVVVSSPSDRRLGFSLDVSSPYESDGGAGDHGDAGDSGTDDRGSDGVCDEGGTADGGDGGDNLYGYGDGTCNQGDTGDGGGGDSSRDDGDDGDDVESVEFTTNTTTQSNIHYDEIIYINKKYWYNSINNQVFIKLKAGKVSKKNIGEIKNNKVIFTT